MAIFSARILGSFGLVLTLGVLPALADGTEQAEASAASGFARSMSRWVASWGGRRC